MKKKYLKPESVSIILYGEGAILSNSGDDLKANDYYSDMEQMSNRHGWDSDNWEE